MVRQKRGNITHRADKNSSADTSSDLNTSTNIVLYWKQILGCILLGIAVCFGYRGYLETRVNTPFDDRKMVISSGLHNPEQYWGTYRPGIYFGLKTRDPHSLLTGLMWYFPRYLKPDGEGIRHWCEQSDNLEKYGWLQHDGSTFGVQNITDGPFILTTSFIKRSGGAHGGDWTARIDVNVKTQYKELIGEEVSLIWYIAAEEDSKSFIAALNTGTKLTGMKGQTAGLGQFTIKLSNYSGIVDNNSYLSTITTGTHLLRETVMSSLRIVQNSPSSSKKLVLAGKLLPDAGQKDPNFVASQIIGKVPFTLDVVFESGSYGSRDETLVGETYSKALLSHQSRFSQRFENTFHVKEKGYDRRNIEFAQAAVSNLIGGIGYFYGTSKVQSFYTAEPVHYWKAPLYTAVPSRSFFPRGFLWDEGFHGLLIGAWDIDIELDIMTHWFDLMNVEGWIPREQILGSEALAKVPAEFVVQRNTNANPPTFFLTLQYILNRKEQHTEKRLATLERMFPRLEALFSWFSTSQKGSLPNSYRWRGRDGLTKRELNPKTLTSGLDDYPRASHPSNDERHIDLYCWIAHAADVLSKLADVLDRDGYKYEKIASVLKDNSVMDQLHWSNNAQAYADYGLHTDAVIMKRPKPQPRSQNQNLEMTRLTMKEPEYRFVDSTFGYISLFPFLLHILEDNSPKLGQILKDIQNTKLLWTDYGLRSLAKSAPLYMKRNTEHDPPYWRGPIWINMNYLALRALYYYSNSDGIFQNQSAIVYHKLRNNVVNNVIKQYYQSGYIWEQYNDITGEGSGCRPFTGWSALVVSIMSEHY